MKKYILEIVVFISGAVVMIMELVGSRLLAPYVGTSIVVWTSLIGIILGSLSLGYWYGGKLADKSPTYATFSRVLLLAALCIFFLIVGQGVLLPSLGSLSTNVYITSALCALLLFAPASVLLGMVSPYAVKLKITDIATSGRTVGNLYALSTVGSIAGTFVSGFVLISYFKLSVILAALAVTMLLLSFAVHAGRTRMVTILYLLLLAVFVAAAFGKTPVNATTFVYDTRYNRVTVYETPDPQTGKTMRVMRIGNEFSSGMFLDSDELVFDYTNYYDLARHFNPALSRTLMIGGAGYSYPKYFLSKYATATIDVVEIDPELTDIARKHFELAESKRLSIIHADGRVFLNQSRAKYDAIFGDAFKSYSPPFHLTTKEAAKQMYEHLTDNGVVVMNIISSLRGETGEFLAAEYHTLKAVFPQVLVFPVTRPQDGAAVQNIILVALKSANEPLLHSADPRIGAQLQHLWQGGVEAGPVLTDDFAPVEHYFFKILANTTV